MSTGDTAILLVDDGLGRFGPMVDLRPIFCVRSGAMTMLERIEALVGSPPHTWSSSMEDDLLSELCGLGANTIPDVSTITIVNGRIGSPKILQEALGLSSAAAILDGEVLVAATLPGADVQGVLEHGKLPDSVQIIQSNGALVQRPWDMLDNLRSFLEFDLALLRESPGVACVLDSNAILVPGSVHLLGDHPITASPGAMVAPGVVIDAQDGPVHLGVDSIIRPNAVLVGPCLIGDGTTIIEHALVKSTTSIGPVCKVGGEIGGSIIQGCSNKSHDGHLGDAYVGEWVNFGAGTTVSNLMNTYGEIITRLAPEHPRERTGRTYLGPILGDHVKMAIGTRLMTGTVLGTGTMVACSCPPPTTVGPLRWITDKGDRPYEMAKFADVMRTVMARRGREPSVALLRRLDSLRVDQE